MKLRTTMVETACGRHAHGTLADSSHDLMAAHALMMALEDGSTPEVVAYITKLADKLMAEWGFDTQDCPA